MNWARLNFNPVVYDDNEAWMLPSAAEGWRKISLKDVQKDGAAMSEADFDSFYRFLPPLPAIAFAGHSPLPRTTDPAAPAAPLAPTYSDIGRRVRHTVTGEEGIITSFDEGHEHAKPSAALDQRIFVHFDKDAAGVIRDVSRAELEWSRFHHGEKPSGP